MPDGGRIAQVDVLRHQGELLEDVTSDTLVMVCGYGGGKTKSVVMKALQLAGINWPVPVAVFEPTYPMVRDTLVPMFEEHFAEMGVAWRYNKNEHVMHVRMRGRWHQILLRSTDNTATLKGPNFAAVLIDEAGIHKPDVWRHLPPRARHPKAKVRQVVVAGTPEGFNDFFEWAEGSWDEKKRGIRHVVRAETYDNVFLVPSPQEYVRTRLSHLDEADIEQYVRGRFVARGTRVYRSFDRSRHGAPCTSVRDDAFVVGADFNVGKMCWVLGRIRGEELHVWGELVRENTTTWDQGEALSTYLQERLYKETGRYLDHASLRRRTTIHADPSAKSRSTRASESDVQQLRAMGYEVICSHEPIPVKDRVMTVNSRFRADAALVDTAECPYLTKSLEQQGRDKNGEPEKSSDPQKDLSGPVDALGYGIWGIPHWRATVPRGNEVRISSYV